MAALRIGHAVSRKKQHKFVTGFAAAMEAKGVEVVGLDFVAGVPADRVDVLLHKLVDELAAAPHDPAAAATLQNLHSYAAAHPDVPLVDPWDAVSGVMDRAGVQRALEAHRVRCPPSLEWRPADATASRAAPDLTTLRFPLFGKPLTSCGLAATHDIAILRCPEDLQTLPPHPLLLQSYIPHDGTVWKVYVVGAEAWVARRGSVTVASGDGVRQFNSQTVCQPAADAPPAVRLGTGALGAATEAELLGMLAGVRAATGLSLIGVDVIVEDGTGNMFCVDVNYFPAYKEVADVNDRILAHLRTIVAAAARPPGAP